MAEQFAWVPVVAIPISTALRAHARITTRIAVTGWRTQPFTSVDAATAVALKNAHSPVVKGLQGTGWVVARFTRATAIDTFAAIPRVTDGILPGVARMRSYRAATAGHEGCHHGNR